MFCHGHDKWGQVFRTHLSKDGIYACFYQLLHFQPTASGKKTQGFRVGFFANVDTIQTFQCKLKSSLGNVSIRIFWMKFGFLCCSLQPWLGEGIGEERCPVQYDTMKIVFATECDYCYI